ncbi:MAG: hypothetical protein QM805_26400 [Pseudomonas sp.]
MSNIETMEPEWPRVVVISTGRTLLIGRSIKHQTNLNPARREIEFSLRHINETQTNGPFGHFATLAFQNRLRVFRRL